MAISDPARATASVGAAMTAPHASAVAWGAIIGGAVAAMSTTLVLLALGAGLGLTAASPWAGEGMSAKAIGVAGVIWMVVVQWLSAALGGFLTGRLRIRWNYLDRDEVFFRDTAHGFLAWALAVGITAFSAATLTAGVVGIGAGGAAAGAASNADDKWIAYYTDTLFRTANPAPTASSPDQTSSPMSGSSDTYRTETGRILTHGLSGDVAADDRDYLAQQVAARTGLSPDEARKRVDEVITKAKQAADAARKAAASLAIATALSLAVGAFIAAVAAGVGGRERDE